MLRELGGTRVEVTRHRYGPSRITLTGPGRKQAAIEFILDCSHSMTDPVAVEAPGVSGQKSPAPANWTWPWSRCGHAGAVRERGDMRIGVRFFGHRVG